MAGKCVSQPLFVKETQTTAGKISIEKYFNAFLSLKNDSKDTD